MFTLDIGGKQVECELNFGSAVDYELEFGRDLVADVNGSVERDGKEFVKFDEDGETVVSIDFSAVPWTTLLKVLWIAVKTKNPRTKKFEDWAKSMRGVDMFKMRGLISEEIEDCFFRDSAVEQDEEQ